MIIDRTAYDVMIEHMREAAPREGVGLLAGLRRELCPRDTNGDGDCGQRFCPWCDPEAGRGHTCDRWVPLRNISDFPRLRYEADTDDLLTAWQALESDDRRPWITCHSHTRTSSAPSELDIRYAVDPSMLHMIVSLAWREPVAVLWRLDPNTVAPDHARRVPFQVVDLGKQEYPPTDLTHGVTGA